MSAIGIHLQEIDELASAAANTCLYCHMAIRGHPRDDNGLWHCEVGKRAIERAREFIEARDDGKVTEMLQRLAENQRTAINELALRLNAAEQHSRGWRDFCDVETTRRQNVESFMVSAYAKQEELRQRGDRWRDGFFAAVLIAALVALIVWRVIAEMAR